MPASSDEPPEALERRFHPSALIRGSVALHAAAAGALLLKPQLWPWALAAVVADHLTLTAAGLWPRASLLGPNLTRLPPGAAARGEIALTIDDGPDPEVTPAVLALLDRHAVRASFFCVGERVARHPQLAREIVARGHGLENHSQRHLHRFSLLGPRALRAEIAGAQESIAFATGAAPRFFRAPAGLRNPFLEPELARAGLELVSWTRRGFDTVSGDPDRVLARLMRGLAAGDILLLHDGHAARTASGAPLILAVLPPLLATVRAAGLKPVTLRVACR
ncbi:MAG TPA: polysaccharide deacetylase family protein [Steroidobacteraceae bacterium]|nr:polysaccharide deacetylase family protein [Steroidobacteraceae bacterium]